MYRQVYSLILPTQTGACMRANLLQCKSTHYVRGNICQYHKQRIPSHLYNKAHTGIWKKANKCDIATPARGCTTKSDIKTKTGPPWKVLFLGTDEFSLQHLKALNENKLSVTRKIVDKVDVVIHVEQCAVHKYAESEGLNIYRWPLPDLSGCYDVGVIVSFGHLIPESVINMFQWSILNVHPSILPRWRGASPLLHTVLCGDTETGISIIDIKPHKFDVGPLVAQVPFTVPCRSSVLSLMNFLAEKGSKILLDCLENLSSLEKVEQNTEIKPTYAFKFKRNHAFIDWAKEGVDDIDRHYRTLGKILNLRSQWKNYKIRLLDMVPPNEVKDTLSLLPADIDGCDVPLGFPVFLKETGLLYVKCRDGWVAFENILIRKKMTALGFYNGYLSKPNNNNVCFISLPNKLDRYFNRS